MRVTIAPGSNEPRCKSKPLSRAASIVWHKNAPDDTAFGLSGKICRSIKLTAKIEVFSPASWGCSSAGRAPRSQRGGHRFDPGQLHQSLTPSLFSSKRREECRPVPPWSTRLDDPANISGLRQLLSCPNAQMFCDHIDVLKSRPRVEEHHAILRLQKAVLQ
jgi:hypothetical protein